MIEAHLTYPLRSEQTITNLKIQVGNGKPFDCVVVSTEEANKNY
jgi:hypothetical protein